MIKDQSNAIFSTTMYPIDCKGIKGLDQHIPFTNDNALCFMVEHSLNDWGASC